MKLNLSVWSSPKIIALSGYTIEMLEGALFKLAEFIHSSIVPNKLEGFDIRRDNSLSKNMPGSD
jgi:hypothetical protein